jgi:hypothetical protein
MCTPKKRTMTKMTTTAIPKPFEPADSMRETTFEFVMSPWPTTIEANAKVKLTLVGGAFKSIDQRFQQPDGSYPR